MCRNSWSGVCLLLHLLVLLLRQPAWGQRGSYARTVEVQEKLALPDLPYGYGELEPYVDEATVRVHHGGHHRAYTNKANVALEQWRAQSSDTTSLAFQPLAEVLQRLSEVPDQWRSSIRNNGGGYFNHIFYWESMCHIPSLHQPGADLARDIEARFGSFGEFQREFSAAAAALFGSGYVWLCQNNTGHLHLVTTSNQDCPLTANLYPLMVLDVWEHAYYLKHQNKRSNYISDWWGVVCWEAVAEIRRFWARYLNGHHSRHGEL